LQEELVRVCGFLEEEAYKRCRYFPGILSDTMTVASNLSLSQLRYEQQALYDAYQELLKSGTQDQLRAKALEVIRAREAINRKIDGMNSDVFCLAC
jgi:hypothetical protein